MDRTKLKQAIEFAKQNPDSEYANELRKRIESGQIIIETEKPNYLERVAGQYSDIGERTTEALKKSGQEYLEKAKTGDVLGATSSLLRSGLRSVGAVAEGAFAPIVEAPVVKQALEFVGEKIGNTEIGQRLAQKIQENPETAQDIMDIVNTLFLGVGKITEAPLKESVSKTTTKILEKPIVSSGKAIQTAGVKTYGLSIPMKESTKIAQQVYEASKPSLLERVSNIVTGKTAKSATKPITEAETAARKGLVGTEWKLGVQATRENKKVWDNIIKPSLDSSKQKVNMKQFFKDIEDDIITENADLSRRNALKEALTAVKGDFKKVNDISLSKLQDYKEGWAKFVPERTYKGKPISGALNEVRNLLAQKARQTIYNTLGDDIKVAYIDYGNLKSIAESGLKSVDPLRSKGITKQAWEFVLDTVVTPVATIGGQVLYRTGKGLEFIGKAGAKTVGDIIGSTSSSIVGSIPSVVNNELIK